MSDPVPESLGPTNSMLGDALKPAPNTTYGSVLPLAKDNTSGDLRIAMPESVRSLLQGAADLLDGPSTGRVTPEATMALTGLAAPSLASDPQAAFLSAGARARVPHVPPNVAARAEELFHKGLSRVGDYSKIFHPDDISDQQLSRILEDPNMAYMYNAHINSTSKHLQETSEQAFDRRNRIAKTSTVGYYLKQNLIEPIHAEKLKRVENEIRQQMFPNGRPDQGMGLQEYLAQIKRQQEQGIEAPSYDWDPRRLAKERMQLEHSKSLEQIYKEEQEGKPSA